MSHPKIKSALAAAAAPGFVLERSEAVPALIGRHEDFLFVAGLGGTASDVGAVTGDGAHVYSLGGAMGAACMMGLGLALARPDKRVLVITGDGELQEGSVWEAAMAAHHYGLDNLCAVVDRNLGQNDGPTENIMRLGDLAERWRSFGWAVHTVDGHDVTALRSALASVPFASAKPSLLLARTVKGRGVPGVEGDPRSHYMTLSARNVQRALQNLRRVPSDVGMSR